MKKIIDHKDIESNHRINLIRINPMRLIIPAMLMLLATVIFPSHTMGEEAAQPEEVPAVDVPEADSMPAVARAFELIPDRDLDILTPSMRSDMAIYMHEADSSYRVRNIYSGLSWIEKMNPTYIKVHLTDISSLEIKELPWKSAGTALIMTIYTVSGESDTSDSTIKFYALSSSTGNSPSLTELPTGKFFRLPAPKDFYDLKSGDLKAGDHKLTLKDILYEMPFHTVAYSISPESDLLTGRLTMSNYLTLESRKRLEPYMRDELSWEWTGQKFKPVK